jgi:membrane protein implicated in regulation of membrane protease activity
MGLVYIGLLVVGVVYAFVSGALGWLSDLGGGEIHVDMGGHLDAGHAHPISGTIVATFITGFGAGGVIAHYVLKWSLLGGVGLACVSGLVLAGIAFAALDLIFSQTQAGSEFALEQMVGCEGEIITSIPDGGGPGEMAFLVKGQREVSPARSVDGSAIAKGRQVVIEKVMGATVYVRAKA